MPVVKKEQIGFQGGIIYRTVRINAHGTFTCDLPPDTVKTLGKSYVSAQSLDACITAWNAEVQKFRESKTTVKRIIAYQFKYSARVFSSDGKKIVINEQRISFSDGTALDFAAEVFDEYLTENPSGQGRENYRYEHVDSSIPPGCQFGRGGPDCAYVRDQVPWSEEGEQFFANLGQAFEALIVRLDDWFDSKANLLDAIKYRRLILPATQDRPALAGPGTQKVTVTRKKRNV